MESPHSETPSDSKPESPERLPEERYQKLRRFGDDHFPGGSERAIEQYEETHSGEVLSEVERQAIRDGADDA